MTDPKPSLQLEGWNYERTSVLGQCFTSSPGGMPLMSSAHTREKEKIMVTFAVINAPVMVFGRSGRTYLIKHIVADLVSVDGSPWRLGSRTTADAMGILKNGKPGASREFETFDFPDWLNELFGLRYSRALEESPLLTWADQEYPR